MGGPVLRIPKLREGGHFPSVLEPQGGEGRPLAVLPSACVEGISTARETASESLGLTSTDKSQASRICREMDEPAEARASGPWRARTPIHGWMPLV